MTSAFEAGDQRRSTCLSYLYKWIVEPNFVSMSVRACAGSSWSLSEFLTTYLSSGDFASGCSPGKETSCAFRLLINVTQISEAKSQFTASGNHLRRTLIDLSKNPPYWALFDELCGHLSGQQMVTVLHCLPHLTASSYGSHISIHLSGAS